MTASLEVYAAPGEIVLEGVSRSFSVGADKGRTLKELFVDRRASKGPAPVYALQDVSLHISPGETVGLVGRNGAGKTSTLRLLAGIVPPDRGVVQCGGRIVTLLELGSGFSRDFTGRENIYLNGALHGLSKAQIDERMEPIIAFADLGEFIEAPVKTYSSGMYVRLGFAIAAHLDADVLLIDELLAVGDEAFQRKCMRRISERIAEGATLVLVSHAAAAIERVCERVVILDAGQVVFDGPTPEGLLLYHRLLGTERADSTPVPRVGQTAFEIAELELQDEEGRRSHAFRIGEPLRVALTLRAATAAARALLTLEVRDEKGRPLFATETAAAVGEDGDRLVFVVPRLALLGGDYDLALSVREADLADAPSYDRVMGFSVADEPGGEGVLDLRGTWTVNEPAETVAGAKISPINSPRLVHPGEQTSPSVEVAKREHGRPREHVRAIVSDDASAEPRRFPRLTADKDIVRDFYDQAINGRDASVCWRLLTVDFRHNGEERGRAGQREAVQEILDTFSPMHHEILVLFGEDDLVCARQRWSGTYVGELLAPAATGREVSFTSTAILKIRDGQIGEVWDQTDHAGLIAQLS